MGRWPAAASAAAVAMLGVGAAASAQETPPIEVPSGTAVTTVLSRPTNEYAATGMRIGSFIVNPSFDAQESFDSNIFATPNNAQSDFITTLTPAFSLRSDWAQNAFGLRVQDEIRQYAIHQTENVNNLTTAADGRFDIARDIYVTGGGGYELLHEDRSSPEVVFGKYPTQYTVTSGNAGFVFQPYRLGFRLDGTVDSYGYDNVPAESGPVINETARDRIVYALTPRVSYEITPQYDAFVRAVVNTRQYNSTRETDGLDRSSTGYEADLGTTLDLADLVTGEVYGGYLEQNYQTTPGRSLGGVDFGANLLWDVTPIDSLRLNVARSVEESTLIGSTGYLQTLVRLTLEHELLDNVVLVGSADYINAEFQGLSGSSNFYEASLGVRYFFTKNFSAGLEYDFRRRSSTSYLSGFDDDVIAVRLRAQL